MRVFVSVAIFWCSAGISAAKGFDLNILPQGAAVTLPQPATTFVPLNARVTLSATDSPQSLKIMSHNLRGKNTTTIEVAVYDRHSERVRYLTIKPGVPYVYSFKGLSSIMIIPKVTSKLPARNKQVLRIESDRSLTIAK